MSKDFWAMLIVSALVNILFGKTMSRPGYNDWVKKWETDWVTGWGLAFCIAIGIPVGLMLLAKLVDRLF